MAAGAAIAAAAVGAGVTGVFGLLDDGDATGPSVSASGGASVNNGSCISGGVVVQGDVTCVPAPAPARGAEAVTADAGCGAVEGVPASSRFQLSVLMWCAPKAVRGQYQYKLKLSIRNTGTRPLDIRRERFVLLWRTLDPAKWSPPPGGEPEPPEKLVYRDREYWGIAANLDGIAEILPDGSAYTFATHWQYTTLSPKKTSLRPKDGFFTLQYQPPDGAPIKTVRFNHKEDDLVFYVPERAVNRDKNFLGLGYRDRGRIIALCPQDEWGPKVSPNAF